VTAAAAGRPRIALLCATRRGLRFLEKLVQLAPDCDLVVMSFPEDPEEPRFLDDIRTFALANGATFIEGRQAGHERHRAVWEAPLDLLFAVSWRYMVPPSIYGLPRRGSFVLHDSLLPEYRGFAPTVWAIVNGEDHTGVTLFEMADAIDAGAIVDQRRVRIALTDTIATVIERVTDVYLAMLEDNLPALLAGSAPRRWQDETAATYTCRRLASDGVIDWSAPSRRIYDLIRAVTKPYWGARTTLDGRELRIWESRLLPESARYVGRVPGRVIDSRPGVGATVLTGDGALLLTRVQGDGEIVCASELINSLSQTLGR
jgi:methionyl-tRNA formyltransferase